MPSPERLDACSLPPGELEARLRMIRTEILPALVREVELPDGFALEFGPEMRARLEAWAALERRCCSSLSWRVVDAAGAGVRLEVRGAGAPDVRRAVR